MNIAIIGNDGIDLKAKFALAFILMNFELRYRYIRVKSIIGQKVTLLKPKQVSQKINFIKKKKKKKKKETNRKQNL